jgi:hypothetical protein
VSSYSFSLSSSSSSSTSSGPRPRLVLGLVLGYDFLGFVGSAIVAVGTAVGIAVDVAFDFVVYVDVDVATVCADYCISDETDPAVDSGCTYIDY